MTGNTAFALDLYAAIAGSDENLFYSPYSISLALALAYAGAKGETEQQMAEVLRFSLPQDRLHPALNFMDLTLTSPAQAGEKGGFELGIVNSVWGQEGHEFFAAYFDTLTGNYGGEVRQVDYRDNPRRPGNASTTGCTRKQTGELKTLSHTRPLTFGHGWCWPMRSFSKPDGKRPLSRGPLRERPSMAWTGTKAGLK